MPTLTRGLVGRERPRAPLPLLVTGCVCVLCIGGRWTSFERAEGCLIKPDTACIDIGRFTVDAAYEAVMVRERRVRIGEKPLADKTVEEIRGQASYFTSNLRGTLGTLISGTRGPPLTPEAFEALLATKCTFTNGADSTVVADLYRTTATALLGSTTELKYSKLEWSAADYKHLAGALRYCGRLEELKLTYMEVGDEEMAALVEAAPLMLKKLGLSACHSLTALPAMPALPALETLELNWCRSLTALADLSKLTALKELELRMCSSLTALPDLSKLTALEKLTINECSSLTALPDLSKLTALKELKLWDCSSLTALPDLSKLTALKELVLRGCRSLTALPDLSKITALKLLNIDGCRLAEEQRKRALRLQVRGCHVIY